MFFNLPNQGGDSISPSFAHTACFTKSETSRVGWTTSKSGRKTVTGCQLASNSTNGSAYLYSWITIPASRSPSLHGVATSQTYLIVISLRNTRSLSAYILILGIVPSGGVMKLALLNPDPSVCQLHFILKIVFTYPEHW